jgi:hypothetical protein
MQAHGGAEAPDARPPARAGQPGAGTGPAILPARACRRRPGPATRTTGLILGPVETAPRCARGVLAGALAQWGLLQLREPGEEIISELVTNAVAASRKAAPPGTGPRPVTVWVTAGNDELCIRVWDPDPAPPPAGPSLPDDLAESGRGLFIVTTLSSGGAGTPRPTAASTCGQRSRSTPARPPPDTSPRTANSTRATTPARTAAPRHAREPARPPVAAAPACHRGAAPTTPTSPSPGPGPSTGRQTHAA